VIRYDFDSAVISAEVAALDPKWEAKAAKRTNELLKAGSFPKDGAAIWSKIKPAFMKLQHNKCVYCERQLANHEYGTIEWDVEHFRPKSTVEAWPDNARHFGLAYAFSTGGALSSGYYWLAYNLGNYAASCKICNSTFKHVYFPVAAPRRSAPAQPDDLLAEEPFLCLPIGSADEDPENLIQFIVTTAIPTADFGRRRERGQIIIDFFGLNKRDDLHRERAQMIGLLGNALISRADGPRRLIDDRLIERLQGSGVPHANCVRSFLRLWNHNQPLARRAHELCLEFGFSDAGTAPPRV
jgi:hypothetical protein